jgi:quercetin dioxygenase-like cupin family protein
MKPRSIIALFVSGVFIAAFAAEEPRPPAVVHLDHEKVAAAFASGSKLLVTPNFKVQTGNRTGPGEVEVHDRDTDIFYILEGSATFITGGTPIGVRSIGEGETRAKEITGGQAKKLVKGDVIVIPKAIPHWFKEVSGPFIYYVVKVTN